MLPKHSIKSCNRGFSLMEVLTAVGILAIISTMTMAVFVKQMHHGAQEDNRRAAVNLMDDFIEKIYRVNINQLPNIVNTGGFDETYGQVPGHPLFSRRIKTFQQLPTQEPSYLIEVEIRWKYRDGESPSYTQWITKTQLGGN